MTGWISGSASACAGSLCRYLRACVPFAFFLVLLCDVLSLSLSRQTMQGNIWAVLDGQGLPESMTLVLRFQLQPSLASSNLLGGSFDQEHYSSLPSNQIAGLK